MAHWYPAQSRISAIAAELKKLEQFAIQPTEDASATVSVVSATLSDAVRSRGFPQRQLRQWTWIGSQYRLHAAAGGPVAAASGGALAFLAKRVCRPLTEEDEQDLNWVLENGVRALGDLLEPGAVASHLSAAELSDIEARLESLAEADYAESKVRPAIEAAVAELTAFSHSPQLQALSVKVEGLVAAARRDGPAARTARAALLYLAEEKDAVSDAEGFLGLMDDVYVVDVAFAAVEQQTRCLPLLNGLLADYPYVADVALVGEPSRPLDLFAQYVVCAALDCLRGDAPPTMLVVRESGPFPLLSAFFAAVRSARAEATSERSRLESWPAGQPIVVSDGTHVFKANFLGEIDMGSKRCFRLQVDKNGTQTVPVDLAPYMSASPAHKRLSSGSDLSAWLKSRHVDPLVNLMGSPRTRLAGGSAILLVGPRFKLDAYLRSARPLGADIGAAVGLRYMSATSQEALGGTATDTPYIYACSDADTAYDLIRHPPAHVSSWRVIVDGARQTRALHASLSTDGQGVMPPLCGVVELHDRETAADLLKAEFAVWYLEDQDVRPPSAPLEATGDGDLLGRTLARQSAHWHAVQSRTIASHPFLEAVDAWMVRAEAARKEGAHQHLELAVSAFMRAALARPLASTAGDKALADLGRGVAFQAATLRNFSPLAAELHGLFAPLLTDGLPGFGRREALAAMSPSGTKTAVVCRSAQIAAACSDASRGDAEMSGLFWTNLEGVRANAPFDRIVVPGWLDRLSMRELAGCGYGTSLELVFYPFEQRWFDRTMAAGARWERRIEAGTLSALTNVSERLTLAGRNAPLWSRQTSDRLGAASAPVQASPAPADALPVEDDAPEYERLEARSLDAVRHAVFRGRENQPVVRTQLVVFEEPGSHAFLRTGGKVIVLSGPRVETAVGGQAEKLLYRSVETLEPGWLLAIPRGGDRDLVDARADQFIPQAATVRGTAGLWKRAIRNYLDRTGMEASAVARRMREAGVSRDAATIRYWTTTTATIAPRGYREVIPVIARLTGDPVLSTRQAEVIQAIDLIYRARSRAAEVIVAELFAGEIDLDAPELKFDLDGAILRYGLHRIQSLEGLCDAPADVVGKVRSVVGEVASWAGAGAGATPEAFA